MVKLTKDLEILIISLKLKLESFLKNLISGDDNSALELIIG